MSFNTSAFTELVSDPRYDILKKPIKVDKDNKAYELQLISPATAKGTYVKTIAGALAVINVSETCYNSDNTLHYIDVYLGADFKANMQGSFLYLKYHCAQARRLDQAQGTAYWGNIIASAGAAAGASMPWNPLWIFNTIALKGNQSQQPIEQYISAGQYHHITTAKFLNKYKWDALEGNDMTFLTPCIESAFDVATLSTESAARAIAWMGASGAAADASGAGTTSFTPYVKMIPLADVFESCEVPAIWNNLNRFRLEFTFKLPDAIPFNCGTPANSGPAHVFIDECKLMLDTTRMQAGQLLETSENKLEGVCENIGFMENSVIPMTYSLGQQLVGTGQKDVQQVIVGFPAIGNLAAAVNPIQYHCAYLTSLSLQYGGDMPLRSPLILGGVSTNLNAQAYAMYRKSIGADRASVVAPAISFHKYQYYHLYHIPIYNPMYPHRNNDPKDIRIDSNSVSILTASVPVVLIMRKFTGVQIASDGSISHM